jgi:hypothetical protein
MNNGLGCPHYTGFSATFQQIFLTGCSYVLYVNRFVSFGEYHGFWFLGWVDA